VTFPTDDGGRVSRNWFKKDANFQQNPKVMEAGFWGAVVYDALLAINRQHQCDGHIKPSLCRPEYVARYLHLDAADGLSLAPVELARNGLVRAAKAKLISMSVIGVQLTGWTREWRDALSTERTRKWRAKQDGNEAGNDEPGTSRDVPERGNGKSRVEESRSQIPETEGSASGSPAPLPTRGPFTEATRAAVEAIRKASGLPTADQLAAGAPGKAGNPESAGKRRRGKLSAPTEALALAVLLVGYVVDNQPDGRLAQQSDAKRAELAERWADSIRLLHQQDGLTYAAIEAMIHWAQKHEFWSGVILSGANLRDKWDTMAAQRGRGAKPTAQGGAATGPATPIDHEQHPDGEVTL
jgi:hypothetical protein